MVLNPNKRLTALQALNHPYVAQFKEPASEIVLKHAVLLPSVDDNQRLTINDYKRHLYDVSEENHGGREGGTNTVLGTPVRLFLYDYAFAFFFFGRK